MPTSTRPAVALGEQVASVIFRLFKSLPTNAFVIKHKGAALKVWWSFRLATVGKAICTILVTHKVIFSIKPHATDTTGAGIGQKTLLNTGHHCREFYAMTALGVEIEKP